MMVHIQEPKFPWEIVHMDWVTALPPGGDRSYNACLVLVDRYRKTPMFLPYHKDDTAMDTAMVIWSNIISHTGLFQNGISERDPNLTSALCTNLHTLFRKKLSQGLWWNTRVAWHSGIKNSLGGLQKNQEITRKILL
ncbi:hypothetical protein O181_122504 [Austropuccinia psidii MF-1]|uniref:Integrase catalytic domain-containing protein n=1 Tax=Austropuccinia psidii MF-1 TaxID=1389203 RepID=A0A9Q3KN57_9BASI|nr:hypothetical protein [Austropuccinia psidii MF-1]